MEEVRGVETQNVEENQEINYKEEYEKLVAENQRSEVLNNFKNAISSRYKIDEEKLEEQFSEYDNATLSGVIKILGSLEDKPPVIKGCTPAFSNIESGVALYGNGTNEEEKTKFSDYAK